MFLYHIIFLHSSDETRGLFPCLGYCFLLTTPMSIPDTHSSPFTHPHALHTPRRRAPSSSHTPRTRYSPEKQLEIPGDSEMWVKASQPDGVHRAPREGLSTQIRTPWTQGHEGRSKAVKSTERDRRPGWGGASPAQQEGPPCAPHLKSKSCEF